jgi:hypothetical protein
VRARTTLALAAACGVLVSPLSAQTWRLRLDGSAQRVDFHAITADSVAASAVTTGATGGPLSPDGFAVDCAGNGFCYFFRPGAILRGIPASAGATLTMWGFGVTGLSVHVNTRLLTDLTGDRLWPGTSPTFRLVEGYAEYLRGGLTAQGGRMLERGRLASTGTGGLDGLRATYRFPNSGVEVTGYGGWGLARGTILSVTSPAVNPLVEFQPSQRQLVAGAVLGVHRARLDAETEYRRDVDPVTDYFVSERAALSAQLRVAPRYRFVAGADYDLAQGRWGSAEGTLYFTGDGKWATLGAKHYRPFFDLWTVWGAFSPVPYNGVNGSIALQATKALQLQGRGEWFKYDAADVSTPTVTLEDRGWRWGVDLTYARSARWTAQGGAHAEFAPGASSSGIDGRVTWHRSEHLDLGVQGGSLERPLELRFQDAGVRWLGVSADFTRGEMWRVGGSAERYWESRDRPDAAAFDWNQWRLSLRLSLTLRSAADRWLPPARPPGGAP